MGSRMVYLPFAYALGGKYVAVTEAVVFSSGSHGNRRRLRC